MITDEFLTTLKHIILSLFFLNFIMKKIVLTLSALSLLGTAGCQDTTTIEKNDKASETMPKDFLSNLDHTTTQVGLDADKNGIRDDIDEVINTYPNTTDEEKKAMRQKAKFHQLIQFHSQNNALTKEKAAELSLILDRASNCLADIFLKNYVPRRNSKQDQEATSKRLEVSRLLEAITHNTKVRAMAYLEYNRLRNNTWSEDVNGNTCDQ
jgi:hypothetical protein